MVKQVSTSEDTEQNNSGDIVTQNATSNSQKGAPIPRKRGRTARVVQVTERSFEEELPERGQGDTSNDEEEELDDEALEILNFESAFSEFGEGGFSLLVYGLPDSNPRGFNRLGWEFIDVYPFDPLNWLIDLRENFPDGGRFQLHLRDSHGQIRKRKTVTLARKRQRPSTGQSNPEKSNTGQPDAKPVDPVEMMRASLEPLKGVMAILKDFGLAGPTGPPPEDEFTKAAKNLLLDRLKRDDEPTINPERPPTWADVVLEVGREFVSSNPGVGTELLGLLKPIFAKLIIPNIQPQAAPPRADAEGAIVHDTIEPGAVEADATVISDEKTPQPPAKSFDDASAETLGVIIGSIIAERPTAQSVQYINQLEISYPEESKAANYKQIILAQKPSECRDMLLLILPDGDSRKEQLKISTTAEQWIAQLQKELKK